MKFKNIRYVPVVLYISFGTAHADEPIRPMNPNDHYLHPLKDSYYTENWNYGLMLEDGQLISVSFLVTNIGVFSGTAGVRVTLCEPGKPSRFIKDERRLSDFSEDQKTGRIAIGKSSHTLTGNKTRITLQTEALTADLTISAWMAGFRTGCESIPLSTDGKKFYTTFFEIPRGDVEGTMTVDGKAKAIKGAAYMDHAWLNTPATEFSYRWIALHGFYPGHTVVFLECFLKPRSAGKRWTLGYITDRTKILGVTRTLALESGGSWTDPAGYTLLQHFALNMPVGEFKVSGTYQSDPSLTLESAGTRTELRGRGFNEIIMFGD